MECHIFPDILCFISVSFISNNMHTLSAMKQVIFNFLKWGSHLAYIHVGVSNRPIRNMAAAN